MTYEMEMAMMSGATLNELFEMAGVTAEELEEN